MTTKEKPFLTDELDNAAKYYYPMKWHNELWVVANGLLLDDHYTKGDAAKALLKMMDEMRQEATP